MGSERGAHKKPDHVAKNRAYLRALLAVEDAIGAAKRLGGEAFVATRHINALDRCQGSVAVLRVEAEAAVEDADVARFRGDSHA